MIISSTRKERKNFVLLLLLLLVVRLVVFKCFIHTYFESVIQNYTNMRERERNKIAHTHTLIHMFVRWEKRKSFSIIFIYKFHCNIYHNEKEE
jgi:hypothetical protein